VIPIPKAHPPQVIETDLRPISLTPTLPVSELFKVLESFIGGWILERIRDKLDANQYRALKRRSTTHALVDIIHHWHKAIDEGQSVRAVFIDFAKAFDHVDHNILIAKLMAFGLPDVIIWWMCSFVRHRRQRVKIGDVMSDWLVMDAGMPQGSFLGPLTFIMLVDSLQASCITHWSVNGLNYLLKKLRDNGTTTRQPGSGRRQSARTVENVGTVNDLLLSHKDALKCIKPHVKLPERPAFITYHQDFQLKCLKKRRAQELTTASVYISQTCRSCYAVFTPAIRLRADLRCVLNVF